jgi:hypothetical protein
MEEICSSETSIDLHRAAGSYISQQEQFIITCENLKSNMRRTCSIPNAVQGGRAGEV